MADTIRSTSEFLHASTGLFKDNTSGEISAQDLRDFVLSAYRPQMFAGGRLTLESGVPISSSDQNAKSILYYTPHVHDLIGLYDGTSWKLHQFSELSITLSSLTPWRVYDVFIYDNSGTLTLELLGWTAPTTGSISGATNASPIVVTTTAAHGLSVGQLVYISGVGGNTNANSLEAAPWRIIAVGSSTTFSLGTESGANRAGNANYTSGGTFYRADQNTARATAVTYQNGVLCKSGDLTRRLLGSILTTSDAATRDSKTFRCVGNLYNRVLRTLTRTDTSSHTIQNVSTYREWNTYGCRCYFVYPDYVGGLVTMISARSLTAAGYVVIDPGLNGAAGGMYGLPGGYAASVAGASVGFPLLGFNYVNVRERELGNALVTLDYGTVSAGVML